MGTAKRPKDWVSAWQAMLIPPDKQAEAVSALLTLAFSMNDSDEANKAPNIIGDLVKNHKVKMKSVEETLIAFGGNIDGLGVSAEEVMQIFAIFLSHVFPKPANTGWGWSRVGWNWMSWWQYAERCVGGLEPERGLDVLASMLKHIQDREGS